MKDEVFKDEIEKASDFKFSANVANVFDDMVNRSVPFYGEKTDLSDLFINLDSNEEGIALKENEDESGNESRIITVG